MGQRGVPDGVVESVVVNEMAYEEKDVARSESKGKCAGGCGRG